MLSVRWLRAGAPVLLALGHAAAAHAGDAAGCKDPDWAPQRLPGFEISSCEHQAWMSVDYELPGGTKTLQGERTVVEYTLTDESQNPNAAHAWAFNVAQGQKVGAKLMSDPENGWQAVFLETKPLGEFWYVYDHGAGNGDSTGSYTLTTIKVAAMKQDVVARVARGPLVTPGACKEPPWLVKPFPYFKFAGCSQRDIDSVTLDLVEGEKVVAGRVLDANYALADESKSPTALVVRQNYVNALQKIGAQLVSKPDDVFNAVLTQKTTDGEFWYIYSHGAGNADSTASYSLSTLQVGGPPPKACTLEIYGVNFDFDKAALRPDSEPVLQQVLALFNGDAQYAAEVSGHTDNVGTPAHNQTLSGERAEAVKAWLVAQGVDASRVTTHGYGDTQPLVPNTSDANRAKNRRVELRRNGCKS